MTRPLLVVDDDTDLREALEEVLRDAGHAVLGACNGREALEVLVETVGQHLLRE
jgi:two-component system, chemotaxis family, chemotaxis protein CheY